MRQPQQDERSGGFNDHETGAIGDETGAEQTEKQKDDRHPEPRHPDGNHGNGRRVAGGHDRNGEDVPRVRHHCRKKHEGNAGGAGQAHRLGGMHEINQWKGDREPEDQHGRS